MYLRKEKIKQCQIYSEYEIIPKNTKSRLDNIFVIIPFLLKDPIIKAVPNTGIKVARPG